jgi:rSAM/selenodomain-associated transferase 2
MRISIVMPVLNEAAGIEQALLALQPLRAEGHEIIVVDGGSADRTPELAKPLADLVLPASRGRALQMNAGAQHARGDVLLFLHADTRLPANALRSMVDGLERGGLDWGRFEARIDSARPSLRLVGAMMNLRSRVTGICTGDQAIFVRRDAFTLAGGYPRIALMEDVELSRKLCRRSRPLRLASHVTTSARRWERAGVLRTIVLMWWLRASYFFGASPARLARIYDSERYQVTRSRSS